MVDPKTARTGSLLFSSGESVQSGGVLKFGAAAIGCLQLG